MSRRAILPISASGSATRVDYSPPNARRHAGGCVFLRCGPRCLSRWLMLLLLPASSAECLSASVLGVGASPFSPLCWALCGLVCVCPFPRVMVMVMVMVLNSAYTGPLPRPRGGVFLCSSPMVHLWIQLPDISAVGRQHRHPRSGNSKGVRLGQTHATLNATL